MVLESFTNPWKAEHRPFMLFLWGMVYAIIGGLLASWVFPASMESIVMVALTAGAAIPLLYNTIKFEEEKDMHIDSEQKLLKEHSKAIMVFMMLFLGMTAGMTALYLVLPVNQAVNLFSAQIETYQQINPAHSVQSTGQVTNFASGYATTNSHFETVFFNNVKVLIFCILFSFVYGAGAIFVLTWNASVIALAIGNVVRTELAQAATSVGAVSLGRYMQAITIDGFARYFIHGFFEIGSYVIAALAGGIISVAIIKKHFTADKAEHIVLDVSDLLIASFVVLLLAAIIEVYITPVLFAV